MVGILLALQINNWNESRKEGNSEKKYLKGIYKDLDTQTLHLNETMKLNKKSISTLNAVIDEYLSNDGFVTSDSLLAKLNSLISVAAPSEIKTSFTELLYSGDIELIRNDALRRNIVLFYQDLEHMVESSKDNLDNVYQPLIMPLLIQRTLLSRPGDYSKLSGNLNEYFKNRAFSDRAKGLAFARIEDESTEVEFVNALNLRLIIESLQLKRSQDIIDKASALKDKIEEQIVEALNT